MGTLCRNFFSRISLAELVNGLQATKQRKSLRMEGNVEGFLWLNNKSIPQGRSDEGVTTTIFLEAPSRRITRSISRGESSIPSSLSLFCNSLV